MSAPAPGQVITFYSYKGGTGRSMALANTGYLLAIRQASGKPVLMIDWDMEAPGLHRYFGERMTRRFGTGDPAENAIETHPGLIDLFTEIRTWVDKTSGGSLKVSRDCARELFDSLDLDKYIVQTDVDKLHLIKAGAFGPGYSAAVNTFKWETLFQLAPWLFTELARELSERYAYVLIDSRTGLTDVSGVCTMLMPEKLVVVFTPNRQSLEGALDLVRTAARYRRKSNDLRPLLVYPLPSRVETAVKNLQEQWRKGAPGKIRGYQPEFETLIKEVYGLPSVSLSEYFDAVLIPHVAKYAYGEEIASMEESSSDISSSAMNYGLFVDRLLRPALPWQDPQALQPQDLETDSVRKAEETFTRCSPAQQETVKRIFQRLVRLARPDEGGEHTCIVAQESDLPADSSSVINGFAESGLLTFAAFESAATVKIAQEGLVKSWPRLRHWLDEDAAFLLWRQGLRSGMIAWEQSKRQPSYLLYGAQLLEAEGHFQARQDDLNEPERAYIAQSRTQYNQTLAFSLSSYATHELLRPTAPDSIQRGVLLAAESFRRAHALEGDQALRQGLGKLAKPILRLGSWGAVERCLLSHGGKRLATYDELYTIRLFDTQSGALEETWSQTSPVKDWCFSPDDRTLGRLCENGLLETRGAMAFSRQFIPPVRTVALSNDRLAIALDNEVIIFDPVAAAETTQSFPLSDVNCLAFTYNGRALVAGSSSGEVTLLSLASHEIVRSTLPEPVLQVSGIEDVALAYGSSCLVAFGFQGEISRTQRGPVLALGGRIAAFQDGRSIILWDALLGKDCAKIRLEDKAPRVSLSGFVMALASENMVRLYDTMNGQEFQRAVDTKPHTLASLENAGVLMATHSALSRQVQVWDISREPPGYAFNIGSFVWDVCFNASGTLLAAAGQAGDVELLNFPSGLSSPHDPPRRRPDNLRRF